MWVLATRKEKSSASQPLRPPCRLFSLSHTGDFFTHPPLGNASREAPLRIPAPATAPGTNTAPAARRACLPIEAPGEFFHTLSRGQYLPPAIALRTNGNNTQNHRHSGIFISRKRKENIWNLRRKAGMPPHWRECEAPLRRTQRDGADETIPGGCFPSRRSPRRMSGMTVIWEIPPARRGGGRKLINFRKFARIGVGVV